MTNLIYTSKTRKVLKRAIEDFFDSRSYLEVDAPIAVTAPGTEVHLDYFQTSWEDFHKKNHDLYLRSSPELHLKQGLANGIDKLYHLGKCFRNGGERSKWHHPEFTMLEYYEKNISFEAFMDLTEELILFCQDRLLTEGYKTIEPPKKFKRISVYDAFYHCTGIELIDHDPELAKKSMAKGYVSIQATDDFETCYFKLLLDVIEPWIEKQGAIFLFDYPPSQSALSKIIDQRAKRFELYLNGIELGNAFWELSAYQENIERIDRSNEHRRLLSKQTIPYDKDFLDAIKAGIGDCCGIAVGFDRLLAVLLNHKGLDDLIPFREASIFPL